MIKKLYSTNVMRAAGMLDVTDEDIRSFSDGEIDKIEVEADDGTAYVAEPGCLLDNEVFGEYGSENMGHFELPFPIVNIHYLYGERPLLMRITGLERFQLERVIYSQSDICVDESDPNYKEIGVQGTEVKSLKMNTSPESCARGAEGVDRLLDSRECQEKMEKRGVKKEYIILHTLPVLPVNLRYHREGDILVPYGTEYLYSRLLRRIGRIKRGLEVGYPDIIMQNEKRMMQEAADELISNGARGKLVTQGNMPCDSLNELYHMIHDFDYKDIPKPDTEEAPFDEDAFEAVCKEINDHRYQTDEDGEPVDMAYGYFEDSGYDDFKKSLDDVLAPMCGYLFDRHMKGFESLKEDFVRYALPDDIYAAAEENTKESIAKSMLRRMYFYKRKGVA